MTLDLKTSFVNRDFDVGAYDLEVAARDMFSAQIENTQSDEGRKMFTELTKFEEGHMRMIDRMRKKLA